MRGALLPVALGGGIGPRPLGTFLQTQIGLLDFAFLSMLFSAAEEYTMSREITIPPRPSRLHRWLAADRRPDLLTILIALAIWRVFFPGLMSADSIDQYGQAVTGNFNDWHPPLLAIAIKVVLELGGAIGLLMLGQCLAGVFGLRALARGCLELFHPDAEPRKVAWRSFAVLVVLLIPLSPLAFYLMTLWKDAWAAVLMLWIGALALDLFRRGATHRRIFGIVTCAVLLGLVRHNAVVVLPVVGIVLWMGVRRAGASRRSAFAFAASPLVLYLLANPLIDAVFHVKKFHTDSAVMALDLVGLCAEGSAVCDRLPWTKAHIVDPGALARYRPGDIGFIFWDVPKHVDPAIRQDYFRLRAEYFRAVEEFPGRFARIKVEAFETLFGLDRTFYFFHPSIVDNPYRLTLNERFAPVRERLIAMATNVSQHPVLRWVSGVHLVWMVVDLVGIVGLAALSWRSGDAKYRDLAAVLLLPAGYYLSYLAATPMFDFRFMYPSTLMVQCVALSWLVGLFPGIAAEPHRPGAELP